MMDEGHWQAAISSPDEVYVACGNKMLLYHGHVTDDVLIMSCD